MVSLAVGQPEQALFEDRVLPVPERQGEAEMLRLVADAPEAVFSPAIGSGAGLVMAEVIPGIAVVAVILAYPAPLALAQLRAPFLPGHTLDLGCF